MSRRTIEILLMAAFALIVLKTLGGCAAVEPTRAPPEVRIEYRPYPVPTPIPCFTEDERPRLPVPTPVDIERATVDQLAAALAADMENERLFAERVDKLFELCSKRIADGTATTTVGK